MRTKAFGEEPEHTLLSSEAVAQASLDVLISDLTGQVIDVRRAPGEQVPAVPAQPGAHPSGPAARRRRRRTDPTPRKRTTDMRGDLVRKLLARCLTTGLAVLAFLVRGAHRGHRLGAGVGGGRAGRRCRRASDPARRRHRRRDRSCSPRASWSVTPAGSTTGFDPALAATALVLLGLVLLVGPLRAAGSPGDPGGEPAGSGLDTAGRRPARRRAAGAARRSSRSPPRSPCPPGCRWRPPCWWAPAARRSAWTSPGGGSGRRPVAVRWAGRCAAHQPEFLLYFSAPPGSEYQVTMWLPYLERIGRPFLVLLREPEFLPTDRRRHQRPGGLLPDAEGDGRGAGAEPAGGVLRQPRREEHPLHPVHPAHPRAAAPRRQRQGPQRQPGLGDLRPDLRRRTGRDRPVRPGRRGDPRGEVRRGRPPAGRDDRGTPERRCAAWPPRRCSTRRPGPGTTPTPTTARCRWPSRCCAGCSTGAPR